ncbi:hypothetical protein HYPSUDRAFT_1018215 [Hypholoma sublateritium FD-334 SS-4]|uniref:non-specific serine/threonine protein kinase n=1 Tax=Hypholoma sublateritium (strain FD-334 SS-4) TaxID=945553 RepID=A0A0D2NEH2_HYPSF|nr:hypothetical protein HYPSUDRAFT_1018215 [Hypholoma sublateritium FD-334 SS-4]
MDVRTHGARRILKNAPTSPQRGTRDARLLKHLPRMPDLQGGFDLGKLLGSDSTGHTVSPKSLFFSSAKTLSGTSILVVCLSPRISEWKSETSREEILLALLVIYNFDNQGNTSLVTSVSFLLACSLPKPPTRRLKSAWDSTMPFHSEPQWRGTFSVFLNQLLHISIVYDRAPPILCYHLFESIKSFFGFLKYAGPRHLPPSRKVLLDEEGYHITHIGQGAFAAISRILYRPTGDVRVMKRITFDDSGLAKYLAKNEVDTLKAMAGNIWFPQLLNDFAEGRQFVVTMPFYRRGDLASFMQHKRHLGREAAKFYSAQLILAIQSLHKVGIIHRDIKPDNIFLSEDGHLVLADFGLAENIASYEGGESAMSNFSVWLEARAKNDDDFPLLWINRHNPLGMRGVAGTYWYTAPEVFRNDRYSFGIDYWSVGVIYYELITGHIPFNSFKPYPENKCPELDFKQKPGQLKDITSLEQNALSQLLSPYPTDRPKTLTDIKNSHLFRDVDWISMSQQKIRPPSLPPLLLEDRHL